MEFRIESAMNQIKCEEGGFKGILEQMLKRPSNDWAWGEVTLEEQQRPWNFFARITSMEKNLSAAAFTPSFQHDTYSRVQKAWRWERAERVREPTKEKGMSIRPLHQWPRKPLNLLVGGIFLLWSPVSDG